MHRFRQTAGRWTAMVVSVVIFFLIASSGRSSGNEPSKEGGPLDSLDVVNYEIHLLSVDITAQEIWAYADINLTAPYWEISGIYLELIDLTVDSVFFEGEPVSAWEHQFGILHIPLPFPVGIEDTLVTRVYYHGNPFHESWGGFHFSGNYAFNLGVGLSTIPHNLGKSWFPCLDNFTDRAVYDIHATVEEDMTAIAGGSLVDVIDNEDGTLTYHWHCDHTMPTYLASLAIGDYVAVSDTFSGMERDVPINIFVRPQDSAKVSGTFVNLKEILGIFEESMGPYPWERVGYTGTAIGAMEHAANIFVPHFSISGNTSYESLMAHELSHMWVGDMVTCDKAEEMWLNEGWASFFGMYYAYRLYNDPEGFRESMRGTHADVLQFCHTSSGDGSYFPLNAIPQEYTYGMAAYDKGATVTQALRFYLGDSLFFETLKAYLDWKAFEPANSFQMSEFMSVYTGRDVNSFFDNWVFNSGTPHYSIDSFNVSPSGDQYLVHVYPRQKRKGPPLWQGYPDNNIMEVIFMDGEWNQWTDTIQFDGETGVSAKLLPFEPTVVFVDPEEKMCDATTDNYKTIRQQGSYTFDETLFQLEVQQITDSAFIQVTHNWAPPDSLKTPVEGLRLSDYRFWRIDGIIPEGFQAIGKFFYTVNNYLDNTLITGSQDTTIILYRKNASEDWQLIPFERIGLWSIGNLYVYDLQAGEYTLAVWDSQVRVAPRKKATKGILKVYPNPARGPLTIQYETEVQGEIRIYSSLGLLMDTISPVRGKGTVTWQADDLAEGYYYVCLIDGRGKQLAAEKLICNPQ